MLVAISNKSVGTLCRWWDITVLVLTHVPMYRSHVLYPCTVPTVPMYRTDRTHVPYIMHPTENYEIATDSVAISPAILVHLSRTSVRYTGTVRYGTWVRNVTSE